MTYQTDSAKNATVEKFVTSHLSNVLGYEEYTTREFNNKFVLNELRVGANIRTDIYYVVSIKTYKEEE
jgi:hypothetical protein